MLSGFFIDRPKFAIVISIVITLAGLLALSVIPVAQYPNITPPQINVSATYPGADAQTVANTIAEPIEEQVNGVQDELYMSSTSSSSGTYSLHITFAIGSDPNIDQVNVQNRVNLAAAQLPAAVSQEGLTIRQQSSNFVIAVNLYSPDNKYDRTFISNYANVNLKYPLSRLKGVGNAQILGNSQYAMRVLDEPGAHDGTRHHAPRCSGRHLGAEHAVRRRTDRPAADQQRTAAAIDDRDARPAELG